MKAPPRIQRAKDAALDLLIELESTRLEVVLMPSHDWDCAKRGGRIRVVQSRNCKWYRDFCSSYQTNRKRARQRRNYSDTKIKRRETVRALERMIDGNFYGLYAERLELFIVERMKELSAAESRAHKKPLQQGSNYETCLARVS
jgi:hypothetical protein